MGSYSNSCKGPSSRPVRFTMSACSLISIVSSTLNRHSERELPA